MTVMNHYGFTRACVVRGIIYIHTRVSSKTATITSLNKCKSQVVSTRFLLTNFVQSANAKQRQGEGLHFAGIRQQCNEGR